MNRSTIAFTVGRALLPDTRLRAVDVPVRPSRRVKRSGPRVPPHFQDPAEYEKKVCMWSGSASAVVMMVLSVTTMGCGDAPSANRSSPEVAAIKMAHAAITGYLVAAKNDPLDAYDTEVMVPAYERGLKVLRDAEEAGRLEPQLLVATIANLPDSNQLELLWLDASFRATGVRVRQSVKPEPVLDFHAMSQWTDEDKKPREKTAYRSESMLVEWQQNDGAVNPKVQKRGGRPLVQLPRDWVGAKLEACLLYDEGKASAYVPVTSRTVEAEKQ